LLKVKVYDEITKDTPKEEEKVWARHILVATEAEAKQVIDRLNKGEDFAKLAAELSTDTGSKTRGGDLGWFGTGVTDKDFEAAAYALKIGEISQPVKSQLGYHVIQLLGREVRPLTDSELSTKKQTAFTAWLTKAKEDLKVQIFDMWTQNVPSDPPFTPVPTTAQ
jgi:peptidyl-prolyl cis-trans isomerase D